MRLSMENKVCTIGKGWSTPFLSSAESIMVRSIISDLVAPTAEHLYLSGASAITIWLRIVLFSCLRCSMRKWCIRPVGSRRRAP